jgi:parvulin-like peptidyl-prolyl isomerase
MNLKSKKDVLKETHFNYIFYRLWQRVTIAIKQNDQISATEEKTIIEDEQRKQIKERKATNTEWHPRLFNIDPNTKEWIYTYTE